MSKSLEERRKRRMQRLLANPEDRLNKIIGIKPQESDEPRKEHVSHEKTNPSDFVPDCEPVSYSPDSRALKLDEDSKPHRTSPDEPRSAKPERFDEMNHDTCSQMNLMAQSILSNVDPGMTGDGEYANIDRDTADDTERNDYLKTLAATNDHGSKSNVENGSNTEISSGKTTSETPTGHRSFLRIKLILCLVVGISIRLSFLTSFGEEYVQTIVYPFVALEIAILGYMNAAQMSIIGNQGGLFNTLLLLSGVNSQILNSYLHITSLITFVLEDFAYYFFAFIITHIILVS